MAARRKQSARTRAKAKSPKARGPQVDSPDPEEPPRAAVLQQPQRLEPPLRAGTRTRPHERALPAPAAHHTTLSQGVCREVLNGLEELRLTYAASDE